ncbi:MAG: hypothetical protein ABIN57_11935, partial [Chitinophagaceae bacterium]
MAPKKLIPLRLLFLLPVFWGALSQAQIITNKDYKEALFLDGDRLERIKEALPLIDKIYKDHAAKNNFP